ncbi:CAP domain-containing protein [Sphingomonas sp. AOB5]|uniref:CAP domain-containing protein n=1 Tax=Sphingomonas sp. AOB5 TaxID=3034017 RepID=UPI0023F9553B|nr:CAP domain-containing protein [Sphingomonas sp. AOB5]MDF7774028.1 CAP domain-containing protein [Sphingomonas sp. AOB5]
MTLFARAAAALGMCWLALCGMSDPKATASLEAGVLERINFARQYPQEYAELLRDYRRFFEGNILFLPGDPNGLITREGPRAVDEAIDFLEAQAPLPPLTRAEILTLAARDHADMQGPVGGTGHVSRDGASPGERVKRRGGDIYVGESISYGHADPDSVVMQFIIDDGVPSRGHRKLIFASDFRYAGVGCGSHRSYRHMCVVDLSGTATGAPVMPEWASAQGGQLFRMPER